MLQQPPTLSISLPRFSVFLKIQNTQDSHPPRLAIPRHLASTSPKQILLFHPSRLSQVLLPTVEYRNGCGICSLFCSAGSGGDSHVQSWGVGCAGTLGWAQGTHPGTAGTEHLPELLGMDSNTHMWVLICSSISLVKYPARKGFRGTEER